MLDVEIIYFNAGGGHRAAARALETALCRQQPGWRIRCTNLFEILDPRGRFQRIARFAPEDVYNLRLARGWTAGLAQELKLLQAAVRLAQPLLAARAARHWLRTQPDLVVSVIPNFNRPLLAGLAQALPGVAYVTVLTDLADYPPAFWMLPGTAQHVVCGSARALQQAREQGIAPAQVHAVSGMLLRPEFYAPQPLDLAAERQALGFDPARPVGLVMFGGHGGAAMASIAAQLADMQLVLICGHNRRLAARLAAATPAARHLVLGFTPQVRRYMQLADYFIGKPGPGSLSEAVQAGLPVVTFRNRWTMPQERYNADWVREHQLGVVTRSHRHARAAVTALLADLDGYRAGVARMRNEAVFELPPILARVHAAAAQARGQAPRIAAALGQGALS